MRTRRSLSELIEDCLSSPDGRSELMRLATRLIGEKAARKLMFGAMIRAAERWRAIKVADFERRRMTTVRNKLD